MMQSVTIETLKNKCIEYLTSKGVSLTISTDTFEHMLFAEQSGKSAHGFSRLPRLVELAEEFAPFPPLKKVHETSNSCIFDCQHNPGYSAASSAISTLNELLESNAIAVVGGFNTDSLGVMGYYVRQLALSGNIGIGMTSSVARIAAWGSTKPIAGTSPLCLSIPRDSEPLVYDASSSKITVGDVLMAIRNGEILPEGTLLDKTGRPTTNPEDFREGSLYPEGGHKGAGLAFMLDLLSGALVGAPGSLGGKLGSFGFMFIGISPLKMFPGSGYQERIESICKVAEESATAYGFEEVTLPGQRSYRNRCKAREELKISKELAATLGI